MPKSRIKTRENRKKEAALSHKNEYGLNDPTPFQAVQNMRKEMTRWKAEKAL